MTALDGSGAAACGDAGVQNGDGGPVMDGMQRLSLAPAAWPPERTPQQLARPPQSPSRESLCLYTPSNMAGS